MWQKVIFNVLQDTGILCCYSLTPSGQIEKRKKMKFLKCECALTERWLQHASILLAAADRLDLRGVHQAPEVVLVVGSIQAQPQTWACQAYHGGDAGGCCVPRVLGLQLHPCLEIVNWRCEALDGGDGQALVVERQQNNSEGDRKYSHCKSCAPVWRKMRVQRLHPSL